jgi:hypothetical protein
MASTGKATGCTTDWEQVYLDRYAASVKLLTDSIRKVFDSANESTSRQNSYTSGIVHYTNLINTPPHFWIGAGAHAGIVNSSLSNTSNLQAGQNALTTTFSGSASFGGDVQLSYFFGKSASFGLGTGIAYTTFSGKLTEDTYSSTFSAKEISGPRAGTYYAQIVSLTNNAPIVENITLSHLYIPITLIYKGKFSDNFGFQIEAGASYSLQYSGSMGSTNALFDFGARYNFNSTPIYEPGTTDNSNSGTGETGTSFEITKEMAAKYNMSVAKYFAMMQTNGNYPVGSGIAPGSTTSTSSFNSGSLGFILRSGVTYYVSPVFNISALVYFESSNFTNAVPSGGYQLVGAYNSGKPNYNSLLNGVSTMNNTQIGLRVSVAHALFYNVDKWKANRDDLQKSLNVEHKKYQVIHTDLMDLQERLDYLKKHKPVF